MNYSNVKKSNQQTPSKKGRKCSLGCTCGRHKKRTFAPSINQTSNTSTNTKTPVKTGGSKQSGSPLGINTKSTSPLIHPLDNAEKIARKKSVIRRERYQLLRVARAIYARKGEQQGLEYVLNYHRTAKCAYINFGDVIVNQSIEHKSCHFKGLMFCGSVWTCPNCAAKVQERRRIEIAQAMEKMYLAGKKAVMVTFTFPHKFNDNLKDLLKKQAESLSFLKSGKSFQSFKKRAGFSGQIRSLEVTHGENGFHPHTHELWFVDKDFNVNEMYAYLLKRWEAACISGDLLGGESNFEAFKKHAIDIKDHCKTSEYLAKMDDSKNWGIDREMAKAGAKVSKKGIHPFSFLTKFEQTGESFWAEKWLEYSAAIHGKAQIFWSKGLKKQCGIDEKTDIEIAAESEDNVKEIIKLDSEVWRSVRSKNAQAFVLEVCENTSNQEVILSAIGNYETECITVLESVERRIHNSSGDKKDYAYVRG